MLIIGGASHPLLAQQIAQTLQCPYVPAKTKKFNNHEFNIQVNYDVAHQDVVLVQSTNAPVHDHLMELLLLADTVKRAGCKTLTAVLPYFCYSRQDRFFDKSSPISAHLVAKLLKTSGIEKVIAIDLHTKSSENFFTTDIKNLDPKEIFSNALENNKIDMIISPDQGSFLRAKSLALKLRKDFCTMHKKRTLGGACSISLKDMLQPIVGKDCLIIDDIVDTGGTLCAVAKFLKRKGARSVSVCVTHGIFSKGSLHKIKRASFEKIFITDTIHHAYLPPFIQVLPTEKLVADALVKYFSLN